MPLAKQLVPISFSGGVDTKTDSKQVVSGKLLLLENGIFTSPKRIQKRNGYAQLSASVLGGSTISTGRGLAAYSDELVLFDPTALYSYSAANNAWVNKGNVRSLNVTQNPVIRNAYQQTQQDSATHSGGLQAFAWADSSGGARYSVVDRSTGQTVKPSTLIHASASKPRVLALGNYLVIVYLNTADGDVYMFPIAVATPTTVPTATKIADDIHPTNTHFDLAVGSNSRAYLALNNNTGGISLYYITTSLAVAGPVAVAGDPATNCIGVFAHSTNSLIYVGYNNNTATKFFARDYDLGASGSTTTMESVAAVYNVTGTATSGAAFQWFWTQEGASADLNFVRSYTSAAVLSTLCRSVSVAARAFSDTSVACVPVSHTSTLQPTYFVLNGSGECIAKMLPSNGGGVGARSVLPSVNNVSSGTYQLALLQKDLLTTESDQANPAAVEAFDTIYTSTGVTSCEMVFFDSQRSYLSAELGENLHVSGGFLTMYDGVAPVEHGFHLYPEGVALASGTTGSLVNGTYQFCVCYEWTDSRGNLHRSAPSVPVSITLTGANDSVTVTIPTLRVTSKTNVTVVVYRTEAAGTIFYRDSLTSAPTFSSTTTDTVTFSSTQVDADLVGNPPLYTTGGVVENIAAPACGAMTTFKNRLLVLPSEKPLTWWASKQVVPGAPVEFSDLFEFSVDPKGGKLTAVADLDGTAILFKRTSIFAVSGEGPSATGDSNDFSEATIITTDAGCVDPRSVGVTPAGIVFKSEKGIYLLDRSRQVQYIGREVEAYNSDSVVSAVLIPNTNQVRFGLDSGVSLVFDYEAGQWSVFTSHNMVDAAVFGGQYVFLQPTGEVRQESGTTDNGQPIKLKLSTSWLTLTGLSGFQRVYHMLLLGEYLSTHSLRVGVSYDYNPAVVQTEVITPTAPGTWGSGATWGSDAQWGGEYPLYQFRINFTRQKCTAIQLTIEDVQTSENAGSSASWSALTFMVGAKTGSNKLPASKRFGSVQ